MIQYYHFSQFRNNINRSKMPARKPEQEKEVLDWIQAVLGEPVPDGEFEEV